MSACILRPRPHYPPVEVREGFVQLTLANRCVYISYGDTPTRFADNMMKADAVAYLQEHGGVM